MIELINFLPLFLVTFLISYLIKNARKAILAVLFSGLLASCASSSNTFEKSPCACDFERINVNKFIEGSHV